MSSSTNSLNADQGKNPLLSTLANRHCRLVITYFSNASEDHASVDAVAAALARRDGVEEAQIAIRLHHAALPKLDDAGIVDYDARTNTVRYYGRPQIDQLAENLPETHYPGGASDA